MLFAIKFSSPVGIIARKFYSSFHGSCLIVSDRNELSLCNKTVMHRTKNDACKSKGNVKNKTDVRGEKSDVYIRFLISFPLFEQFEFCLGSSCFQPLKIFQPHFRRAFLADGPEGTSDLAAENNFM